MTERESKKLIRETFEDNFNRDKFHRFIANLLTDYEETSTVVSATYIKDAYNPYIESYEIIAKYTDVNDRDIDVLIVNLSTESTFTARTRQRNFALDYIKTRNKDAVLVAYVHPNGKDWRFSFVKLETDIAKTDEGKVVDIEEYTSAKRSSFLVGRHENSYTAKKQLLPLIISEKAPRFQEIEEAFSVEKVTKEFFEKYKELFHDVNEALIEEIEKKPSLKEEFDKKEISTVDFSKKLLGQMVFLYFLQKKGWFGVDAKEDWGTGPKNFIRELFRRKEKYGENFFNDVLEPLFYKALAQNRGEEAIYPELNNCRMPFLNGGLFEPMRGYSWELTDILLPDKLFSNGNKTKEGDTGDGVLDVFDRYNFTVNESDPLEKEVAVDPEMLGKVFENLLDVKDRKSKGSYYTPREIVHYMCQECLINYLETETKGEISKDDIEEVVLNGETIIQNDLVTLEKQREKEKKGYKYTGTYELKLPESIRKNARRIDDLLKDIKVCDPAVGSGAFPLGMINEIIGVRQVLQVYLRDGLSSYDLKYYAIANSIHGVDLDPGAVEIARLRLWLSLVVEEKNPRPLPNLEHRIMQGNSLLSEYEGIQLFNRDLLAKSSDDEAVQFEMIYDSGIKGKIKELERNIKSYVDTSQRSEKQKLRGSIDKLRWEIIEETLKEQGRLDKVEEIRKLRERNVRPFFVWELEFSEVFKEKGGFDIVIGNPPYVRIQDLPMMFVKALKSLYKSATGKFDLYICFSELAIKLKRNNGIVSLIMPNKFLHSNYGVGLRNLIVSEGLSMKMLDFDKSQVFTSATTYTAVYFFKKEDEKTKVLYSSFDAMDSLEGILLGDSRFVEQEGVIKDLPWTMISDPISMKIHKKIAQIGQPLKAYCEEIFQGIISGGDKLLYPRLIENNDNFLLVQSQFNNKKYEIENDVSLLLVKDYKIKRYKSPKPSHAVIYPYKDDTIIEEKVLEKKYPKVYKYLLEHKEELANRGSERMHYDTWYSLWCPRKESKLRSTKLLTQVLSKQANFALDRDGKYGFTGGGNAGVYGIIPKSRFDIHVIMGILNSKVFEFVLKDFSSVFRGGYYSFAKRYIERIPVVYPTKDETIKQLVEVIINLKDSDSEESVISEYEEKIDELIYQLYALSDDEIKYINDALKNIVP